MRIIIALLFLILFPGLAFAAGPDLSITSKDIRFSKDVLVVGQTVRLYARITNVGDTDMTAFATFFLGNTVLDDSRVISLLHGGYPEEVYIDFIIPAGSFNIRAEIRGSDPADVDLSNNTAITGMITPIFDADSDGVADGVDNCVDAPNPNQLDTDQDGLGDVCDTDDDQDGLSDAVEAELGSNPLKTDTDGDGTPDPNDAYPTDPTKQKIEPLPPVKKVLNKIVEQVADKIQNKQEVQAVSVSEQVEQLAADTMIPSQEITIEPLTFSPRATFSYTHDAWNTFSFRVTTALEDQYHYEWDFGDGVRSTKTEITHVFARSGSYPVILTVQDASGVTFSEQVVVFVPFFTLQNRLVIVLIIFLISLLGIGSWVVWHQKEREDYV